MLRDKIYAVFCKNSIPRSDGGLYAGQIELLQRKLRLNYAIPTLTIYTEKLGKKCTISSQTTCKLQSKAAGRFKSRLTIAKQSTRKQRLFIKYNQICQLQGNRKCIVRQLAVKFHLEAV